MFFFGGGIVVCSTRISYGISKARHLRIRNRSEQAGSQQRAAGNLLDTAPHDVAAVPPFLLLLLLFLLLPNFCTTAQPVQL